MNDLSPKPVLQKLSEKFQLFLACAAKLVNPSLMSPELGGSGEPCENTVGFCLATETLPDGSKQDRLVVCWAELSDDKVVWTPLADLLPKARVDQMEVAGIVKNSMISAAFYKHLGENTVKAGGFHNISPEWLLEHNGPHAMFFDLAEQLTEHWRNN